VSCGWEEEEVKVYFSDWTIGASREAVWSSYLSENRMVVKAAKCNSPTGHKTNRVAQNLGIKSADKS
jgi:hypothetical protein